MIVIRRRRAHRLMSQEQREDLIKRIGLDDENLERLRNGEWIFLGVGFLSVEKELDQAHQPTGQWKPSVLLGDRGPYFLTKNGDLATAKALALQVGRVMLGQALDIVAHAEVRLDVAMDDDGRKLPTT